MSKEEIKIWELRNKYSPELDYLISIQDVSKKSGLLLRKIRYNVSHGLLRKTIRRGRESYFEKVYIFPALDCLSIFQYVFKLPLREIKKIMTANDRSIEILHENIKLFLDKYSNPRELPVYYHLIERKFLDRLISGDRDIDIRTLENEANREYENDR